MSTKSSDKTLVSAFSMSLLNFWNDSFLFHFMRLFVNELLFCMSF
jgi:hypothetical protein